VLAVLEEALRRRARGRHSFPRLAADYRVLRETSLVRERLDDIPRVERRFALRRRRQQPVNGRSVRSVKIRAAARKVTFSPSKDKGATRNADYEQCSEVAERPRRADAG
jgi:hypothetical protein